MSRSMVFVTIMMCSSVAFGAGASGSDQQEAERLFRLGRQALDARKFTEARDRFEASLRLYPGTGVKLNLGTCYVALDDLEKADAMFRAAETEAKAKDETTRFALAREGLADVEKHKATLTLKFAPELPASAEVQLDAMPVARARLLYGLPVFKGRHALRVKVPGEAALEKSIDVPKNNVAQTFEVAIPPSWSSSATEPGAHMAQAGSGQRTVGYIVGGVGAAGLVATSFGVVIFGQSQDWLINDQNRGTINMYTYLGIGSAALLATGAVLVLTSPKADADGLKAALHISPLPGGATAVLGGTF